MMGPVRRPLDVIGHHYLFENTMEKKIPTEALRWIVDILESNNVPYQIEGGLAAICYGSNRELADIDIFIPNSGFTRINEAVKPFNQFGPDYYIGTHWKLIYQVLNHNGQEIELCDADDAEYLDTKNNLWIKRDIDFGKAETMSVFGTKIKVISKSDLIEYKGKLGRNVDLIDIERISITS
jgi:predicted nucleotidyltransferase